MKPIIISFLLAVTIKSTGQINIICPNLTDSTLNYFYIGMYNPIRIAGNKLIDNYTIQVLGGGATISKISTNYYNVIATSVTDVCRISIIGTSGKMIYQKDFKVRTLQEPIVTLSGIKDTIASKSRILFNPFLIITIPDSYYRTDLHITSFSATFINGTDSIPTIANGYLLSQEQKAMVKEAETGSRIYFNNIRANGPDSKTRKLAPFWIKIE